MKRLLMLMVVCWVVMPACAQFPPLQVTVQRLSKKKSAQGEVTAYGGGQLFMPNALSSSLCLRIRLQNTSTGPVDNVVVKWGIAKSRVWGTGRTGDSAYGKEEKLSLKPKEIKIIETEVVEAARTESQLSDHTYGEKIRGHGVQVMIGDKVVWEEFAPATVKKLFENLKPPGEDESERPERPTKKSRKN